MEFNSDEFKRRLAEVTSGAQQKEIAEKTGISRSTVSRWFKADIKTPPSGEQLLKIANTYNCSIDYLLCSYPTKEVINDDGTIRLRKSYPDMIRLFLDLFMCGILKVDEKRSPATIQEMALQCAALENTDLIISISNDVCAYLLKEVANFYELYRKRRLTLEGLEVLIKTLCDDFDVLWIYDLPFSNWKDIDEFISENSQYKILSEREQFKAYAKDLYNFPPIKNYPAT